MKLFAASILTVARIHGDDDTRLPINWPCGDSDNSLNQLLGRAHQSASLGPTPIRREKFRNAHPLRSHAISPTEQQHFPIDNQPSYQHSDILCDAIKHRVATGYRLSIYQRGFNCSTVHSPCCLSHLSCTFRHATQPEISNPSLDDCPNNESNDHDSIRRRRPTKRCLTRFVFAISLSSCQITATRRAARKRPLHLLRAAGSWVADFGARPRFARVIDFHQGRLQTRQ